MKSPAQLEEDVLRGDCTLYRFCAEVAAMFRVRPQEVAILELQHAMLRFVHPPELSKTGLIPMISSSQAAKTATSKRAEIFNNFVSIRHSSVFETVKLSGENGQAIQRLMSAPVMSAEGEVMGVMQISRKGISQADAGSEFESSDLQRLREVATLFGRVSTVLIERMERPKVEPAPGQFLTR